MKPIIFSTPMAQALLNTKPGAWPAEPIDASKPCKSQARRVVRYKDRASGEDHYICNMCISPDTLGAYEVACEDTSGVSPNGLSYGWIFPKYKVGDILYVRETWQENTIHSEGDRREIPYLYKADPDGVLLRSWKPSIHMPSEAARLFLEVKSVRVERVQDIIDDDIEAEGTDTSYRCMGCGGSDCYDPFPIFKDLWNSINAKLGYSWESIPWVFVYEFMRVEAHVAH